MSDRSMTRTCDVAVVGGGMAGLVAARELSGAGRTVILLEARERLGGRVWTEDVPDWPLAVELGAEFVHGSAEATMGLIHASGALLDHDDGRHVLRTPDGFVPMAAFEQRIAEVITHIDRAKPDRSIADVLREERIDPETARLVTMFVEGFDAAPVDQISAQAVANEYSAADGQARIVGGYGTLVSFLARELVARGVSVHRDTPVRAIQWGKGRVVIDADGRPIQARAVIIALPLGVLTAAPDAGGISLSPDLDAKRRLFRHLEVGHVVRVVFRLREPVWKRLGLSDVSFLHAPELEFPTWWTARPETAAQITGWCGAGRAMRLAGLDVATIEQRALHSLSDLLGVSQSGLERFVLGRHHHPFGRDPYARGAYSFVRVGGIHAPIELQSTELGTVALAGEFTETENPGTVAAAIASGKRAATAILRELS